MATAEWIVIATSEVEDYLTAPLVDALREVALGDTQTDPVPRIVQDVALRIRAEVQGCSANKISPTAYSIPPSCKQHAMALIVARAKTRLELALTEEQKADRDSAERYLERIAACKVPVEQPADVETNVQSATGIELAGSVSHVQTVANLRSL
jgi:hypothetical protein